MTLLPFVPLRRQRHASPEAPPGQVAVRLRDGGTAHLRPLHAGETGPVLDVFAGMSEASRASRYLAGMPRLPAVMLAALVDVDGCRHAAWLATVDGVPAGIARYVRTGRGGAEVAFEVVDRHHGRGLGAVLLDTITTVASGNGVRRVEATAMPGNSASVQLLRTVGVAFVAAGGLLEGAGDLRLMEEPRVDRQAVIDAARAHLSAESAG